MYSDVSRLWLKILSVRGVDHSRWVRLSRSVPPGKIVEMLGRTGGRRELGRLLGRKVSEPDRGIVDGLRLLIRKAGCRLVSISDSFYPDLLREIANPPPVLYYLGDLGLLAKPVICIVGSRRATRRGLVTASRLAHELSRRDIAVVSGLARGIDSAAHEGALKSDGGTCAVLGCGIDIPYPRENVPLAVEISKRGCLMSEFSPGVSPLKHHFPRRNRILSGLSLGVVVVEAGVDSGAMGTARWAVEQNREVFAVPGPVERAGSRGPHKLIREGATLVESVSDILSELPPCGRIADPSGLPIGKSEPGAFSESERRVLAALELDPKHIDELVQICHISATSILPILLNLEMKGVVESCGGGTYALALCFKDVFTGGP